MLTVPLLFTLPEFDKANEALQIVSSRRIILGKPYRTHLPLGCICALLALLLSVVEVCPQFLCRHKATSAPPESVVRRRSLT